MGGCCCHNEDSKEEDGEEKCMIVTEKVRLSPKKEYGSLSTMEDKGELYSQEPDESASSKGQEQLCSDEDIKEIKESSSCEEDPPSDARHIDLSMQVNPEIEDSDMREHVHVADYSMVADKVRIHDDTELADNMYADDMQQVESMEVHEADDIKETDEKDSDTDSDSSSSGGDVDDEIDQLVAAAMATKVIYPPSTTLAEPLPLPHVRSLSSHQATTEYKVDDNGDSDQEATNSKPLSLMKKTQLSFKKAKAKASTMMSASSKSSTGEEGKKKWSSLHSKKTHRPVNYQEDTLSAPKKSSFLSKRSKRTGLPAQGRMKSHYAKGRVAQFEVEREEKDKLASHRTAVDPRKAALERGERLGQLDDATEEMREQSSSFAQTAKRLREGQRNRTSTFPW